MHVPAESVARRRRAQTRMATLALSVCLGLSLTLSACAASSSAQSGTPTTGVATATSAPAATPTPGGPATPTITPLPGSANLAGATDICTSAISVSTQPPAEIPAFDGQLRLAQSSGGASEFGYCSSSSVQSIAAYFTAQLPGKGWQNIQTFTNDTTRNIIATRGGESLTITVSPDVVQTGNADLLIIVVGQQS